MSIPILKREVFAGPNLLLPAPCTRVTVDGNWFEAQAAIFAAAELRERISAVFPDLIRLSPAIVAEPVELGRLLCGFAIHAQRASGADVATSTYRRLPDGTVEVVVESEFGSIGLRANEYAVRAMEDLVQSDRPSAAWPDCVQALRRTKTIGSSLRAVVFAAQKRGIPVTVFPEFLLVSLGYGAGSRRLHGLIASTTSATALTIAADKSLTKALLQCHGIPVPRGYTVTRRDASALPRRELRLPVVVKPVGASLGRGVTTGVKSEQDRQAALALAFEFGEEAIVEEEVGGRGYRLVVIGYRFVTAARPAPAAVTGDGLHTVAQLVDQENVRRSQDGRTVFVPISVDQATHRLLERSGSTLESVPAEGEVLVLKPNANVATGGTAVWIRDAIHPDNIAMAERIARLMSLDIAGIDVIAPDLASPIEQNGGRVIEVNAGPGVALIEKPTRSDPGLVAEALVSYLCPSASAGIPVVTFTATEEARLSADICAQLATRLGFHVGLTSRRGTYVRGLNIKSERTADAPLAVLLDAEVTLAVVETAHRSFLRAGVGTSWFGASSPTFADHPRHSGDVAATRESHRRASTEGWAVAHVDDPILDAFRCDLFSLREEAGAMQEKLCPGARGLMIRGGIPRMVTAECPEVELPALHEWQVMGGATDAELLIVALSLLRAGVSSAELIRVLQG